jgi:hypothetical protein
LMGNYGPGTASGQLRWPLRAGRGRRPLLRLAEPARMGGAPGDEQPGSSGQQPPWTTDCRSPNHPEVAKEPKASFR